MALLEVLKICLHLRLGVGLGGKLQYPNIFHAKYRKKIIKILCYSRVFEFYRPLHISRPIFSQILISTRLLKVLIILKRESVTPMVLRKRPKNSKLDLINVFK